MISTKTRADVMWKDGSVELGILANDIIPIQHLDSHEFCTGDFVVDTRRKWIQTHLVLTFFRICSLKEYC